MNRDDFVALALVAIGLVILSFFVRGFTQLLVGQGTAQLAQAPLVLAGFGLLVYLFVRATLSKLGVWEIHAE